ncbi:MAG: CHAD domain-containing protein [Saprospiraceae bacterium]|jgi:CHAD domain-containing protein|nr:CHAD domain-containing protein [Saprospiraceae bacterium]MBP9211092.1 CHAD domain-containing protein [Saprospiraceae bacterium]MBV6472129.1 hypothetical protein [Saprospiraceae bacterium]
MDSTSRKLIPLNRRWHQALLAVIRHPDQANIHHFRVSVKKLRVLTSVLPDRWKATSELKKSFRRIDQLFDQAGMVREGQLHLKLLEEITPKPPEKFLSRLNNRTSEAMQEFETALAKCPKQQMQKLWISLECEIENLDGRDFLLHLNKKLEAEFKAIHRRLAPGRSNPRLHDLRIHLRRAYELVGILRLISGNPELDAIITSLHHLIDAIGNWHDLKGLSKNLALEGKRAERSDAGQNIAELQKAVKRSLERHEAQIDLLLEEARQEPSSPDQG